MSYVTYKLCKKSLEDIVNQNKNIDSEILLSDVSTHL